MLKQLEEEAWFIDSNFSIAPGGYYQLLAILVFDQSARTYVLACYVLLQGKNALIYKSVFSALKNLCQGYQIDLRPKTMMTDFETALRNELGIAFPGTEL